MAKTTPKEADKQTEIRREVKKRQKQQSGKGKSTPEAQLPRAVTLQVRAAMQVRAEERALREKKQEARERIRLVKQAAIDEAERRRVKEACENWISYWKHIVHSTGLCQLEKFEEPKPEVVMAIDKLFNYGGHGDPRPGIQMLIGEEYYGVEHGGHYFIAHNEQAASITSDELDTLLEEVSK